MRRKSFDVIVGVGGLLLTVALVAAGALLFWGYSFANSSVSNQLSAQRITFPAATAFAQAKPGTEITPGMIPYLEKYAGQQMTTGAQAQAYANHFIAVHLQQIGKGQTYSELSGAALALPKGSAAYTSAEATVQTVFHGHHPAQHAAQRLRLVADGPDRPHRLHRELRPGRRDPAPVGLRALALPPGLGRRGDPELRPRHHHPEAGRHPLVDRPIGQYGPCAPEPRPGNNPAGAPARLGRTVWGKLSARRSSAVPSRRKHHGQSPSGDAALVPLAEPCQVLGVIEAGFTPRHQPRSTSNPATSRPGQPAPADGCRQATGKKALGPIGPARAVLGSANGPSALYICIGS